MLKDDIATIEDLLYEDDSLDGYRCAWQRIKKILESLNTSTNKHYEKSCRGCINVSNKGCLVGGNYGNEICIKKQDFS